MWLYEYMYWIYRETLCGIKIFNLLQCAFLFTDMAEECCSTQLLDGDGVFNVSGLENFMKAVKLAECGLSYAVVSIMGPQSSGMACSTLNLLLVLIFFLSLSGLSMFRWNGSNTSWEPKEFLSWLWFLLVILKVTYKHFCVSLSYMLLKKWFIAHFSITSREEHTAESSFPHKL